MVMDEYDYNHDCKFRQTINIYSNTTDEELEIIKNNFIEQDLLDAPKDEWHSIEHNRKYMDKDFDVLVKKLKNGLDILDSRYIISISGRILSKQSNNPSKPIWNSVTVFRGYKY